jgi:HK97 gp10 family phage protein
MTSFKITGTGIQEFKELLEEIQDDFGPKDTKNILRNAARMAMQPVLETARALVPKDTGQLAASLQVESRKPTTKDRASKYVTPNDVVIGRVSVAPGSKFKPKLFHNLHSNRKSLKQYAVMDGRAMFVEFGTAKMPAKPYLRPSLESNSGNVVADLGNTLGKTLEKYKAKQARKTL